MNKSISILLGAGFSARETCVVYTPHLAHIHFNFLRCS
jgi:hypothetical protein